MKYAYHQLGYQSRGTTVEVTLRGNAANVRLLDSSNFQNYKRGRQHKYLGGLATGSPVRLVVPHNGHWYVTVDFQGLRGQARSSVRILPNALPPIREYSPAPLSPLVRDTTPVNGTNSMSGSEYTHDVFISHATEDKDDVVRPLAQALIGQNLRVWYDEFELRIGDSLRRKIDAGLAQSRFGIVVLSHAFFEKNWPQYELDGLVTREMAGEQVILPLWHRITKEEIISHSPSLADKIARNTSNSTIAEIAQEIADVIQSASATSGI